MSGLYINQTQVEADTVFSDILTGSIVSSKPNENILVSWYQFWLYVTNLIEIRGEKPDKDVAANI